MADAPTSRPEVAWALALAKAQAATPVIVKDQYNAHAGSSFAPASEFIALSGVLAENDLLAFESGSDVVEGPKGVVYLEVTYAVVHTASGHERAFSHRMALAGHLGDKALTSARTVGMRDFLRGLLLPVVVDGEPQQAQRGSQGRGRDQGRRSQPRGQSQGRHRETRAPGRRGGPAPGHGGPVPLSDLPKVLDKVTVGPDGGRVQAFEDGDAWSLTDWPSHRGEQLVYLAGEWLGVDLMKATDDQRGKACAEVQANRGAFQQFVHRVAVRELAATLAKLSDGTAKGLPTQDEIGQLAGDKLLSARRRLALRVRGTAYGWTTGPCPACESKPKKVETCERCSMTGSVRYPRPRSTEGRAA